MTDDGPGSDADPEREDRDEDEAPGRDSETGPTETADEGDDGVTEQVDGAEVGGEPATGDAGEEPHGRETTPEPSPAKTSGGAGEEPGPDVPVGEADSGGESSDEAGTEGADDDAEGEPGTVAAEGVDGAQAVAAPPAGEATDEAGDVDPAEAGEAVPEDVRTYDRFKKVDRASYGRVNEFLRDRTYITAREWAIARLCADFRTATGVEMTKIGENLPHLVPFMTDTYSPQAVNQARSAFEEKVRMAGATFLYGAMSGFFTADELDDLMYEVTEVAKFLLEVEGVELAVEEELDAEDRISAVMREVRHASEELRYDDVECPHCGEAFRPAESD